MASFSMNVAQPNQNGVLLVDANILINLAKTNQLYLLDRTNRSLVITQEVYKEAILNKPTAPEVPAIRAWLDRVDQNHVILLDKPATAETGRGAGDASLRNMAEHFGSAGVNVVITSNDFDVGKLVPGAVEPTFTQHTLANSLLVGGAISSKEYFDYLKASQEISISASDKTTYSMMVFSLTSSILGPDRSPGIL